MDFYLTVDSENCDNFDRLLGILSITLPFTLELKGQWRVALCQYGLNNGTRVKIGHKLNCAYLTSNLVTPQLIGNQTSRILSLIPLDFIKLQQNMHFFYREIQNPEYVPVDLCCANLIVLHIKDAQMVPISFQPDVEVLFRLHFKPIPLQN